MNDIQAYIGLDVHKDTISVAVAEAGREGEIRSWGLDPARNNSDQSIDQEISQEAWRD